MSADKSYSAQVDARYSLPSTLRCLAAVKKCQMFKIIICCRNVVSWNAQSGLKLDPDRIIAEISVIEAKKSLSNHYSLFIHLVTRFCAPVHVKDFRNLTGEAKYVLER